MSVPVIVMERSLSDLPADVLLGGVRSDHAQGAALAVRHLVECGRTRLGLVAVPRGSTSDPVHDGFRKAVAELLPDSPLLEFDLSGAPGTRELRESCERILDDCIDAGVDGVLVLPDAVAIAFADLAAARGMNMPDELSIVAYDDEIASLAALALTAVSPPKFEVGAVAIRMCVDLIDKRAGVARLPVQSRVTLMPSLAVRDSSVVPRLA